LRALKFGQDLARHVIHIHRVGAQFNPLDAEELKQTFDEFIHLIATGLDVIELFDRFVGQLRTMILQNEAGESDDRPERGAKIV
jgi:hypothetical protein